MTKTYGALPGPTDRIDEHLAITLDWFREISGKEALLDSDVDALSGTIGRQA
jgi:hypothetical protein